MDKHLAWLWGYLSTSVALMDSWSNIPTELNSPKEANPLDVNTAQDSPSPSLQYMPPIIWPTCLFALSSVQLLNKHRLAYATHYHFHEFVSANQLQIRPWMWAACRDFWGWLLMMRWRRGAQVTTTRTQPCIFQGHWRRRHYNSSAASTWTIKSCNSMRDEQRGKPVARDISMKSFGFMSQEVKKVCESNHEGSCARLTCITYPVIYNQSAFVHWRKNRNGYFTEYMAFTPRGG